MRQNMSETYHNYINGQWVSSDDGNMAPDVNPANFSDVIATFPSAGRSEAARAVEAAAQAYPKWATTPMPKRGDILRKAADLLEARTATVAEALTREEGKTRSEIRMDVLRGVEIVRYYAGETLQPTGEVYPSVSPKTFLYAERVPVGVVGLITPWNFPVAIPTWKLAPALAYGNTVVFKP